MSDVSQENIITSNVIILIICITFLLILLVWLRGPELTINHFAPLQTAEQRFRISPHRLRILGALVLAEGCGTEKVMDLGGRIFRCNATWCQKMYQIFAFKMNLIRTQ